MTKSSGSHQPLTRSEEVVVEEQRAVRGAIGIVGAVEVEREAAGAGVGPVRRGHLGAGRGEPPQLGGLDAGQEPPAPEHRVGAPQRDQLLGEGQSARASALDQSNQLISLSWQ